MDVAWESVGVDWQAWIPASAFVCLSLVFLWFEGEWKTTISSLIVYYADVSEMKEAVRNIWNTFSVVAALVAGLTVGILFSDPFGSVGVGGYLSQTFVITCLFSILFCLKTIFYSVVNLAYTEPLHNVNVCKYLLINPNTIGNTIVPTLAGLLLLMVAILVWAAAQYRYVVASTASVFFLLLVAQFALYVHGKSSWDPDRVDRRHLLKWMWPARKESERPRYVNRGLHEGFIRLMRKVCQAENAERPNTHQFSSNVLDGFNDYARRDLSRSLLLSRFDRSRVSGRSSGERRRCHSEGSVCNVQRKSRSTSSGHSSEQVDDDAVARPLSEPLRILVT